jgi:hypothetical protein
VTQLLERERLGTRIEERPPEVMPPPQRFTIFGVSLIVAAVLLVVALGIWLAVALLSDGDEVALPTFFSDAREGQIELRTEIVTFEPVVAPGVETPVVVPTETDPMAIFQDAIDRAIARRDAAAAAIGPVELDPAVQRAIDRYVASLQPPSPYPSWSLQSLVPSDMQWAWEHPQLRDYMMTELGLIQPDYVVEAGDTLSGIATRFGSSVEHLLVTNGYLSTDARSFGSLIFPGDVIGFAPVTMSPTTSVFQGVSADAQLAWEIEQIQSYVAVPAAPVLPTYASDVAWALRQYAPDGYEWWLSTGPAYRSEVLLREFGPAAAGLQAPVAMSPTTNVWQGVTADAQLAWEIEQLQSGAGYPVTTEMVRALWWTSLTPDAQLAWELAQIHG